MATSGSVAMPRVAAALSLLVTPLAAGAQIPGGSPGPRSVALVAFGLAVLAIARHRRSRRPTWPRRHHPA